VKILPVILSGGSGTRLWPLSRESFPKQYLSLAGDKSLFHETLIRFKDFPDTLDPVIVCNHEHRFLVAEECQKAKLNNPVIILEPEGRNTAPAIAAAAIYSQKKLDDCLLLVLSSDHLISNAENLYESLKIGVENALNGLINIFGIKPVKENPNFGYIKPIIDNTSDGSYFVEKFIEKPSLKKVKEFLSSKDYLCNSGIFLFSNKKIINDFKKYSPEIYKYVEKSVLHSKVDLDFVRLEEKNFCLSPADSIDYCILQKSKDIKVVPIDVGWNDLGSWETLYDLSEKDSNLNHLRGNILSKNVSGTYAISDSRLLTLIGLEELFIIDTVDALLISKRDQISNLKEIVLEMKKNNIEFTHHKKVYRPWGWYELLEKGEFFQVKKLHVKPKARLSLQEHKYRAEQWVVVKGEATVINGSRTFKLETGESTYIPKKTIHSIENKAAIELEIIEVQSGSYLGEDDIYRHQDLYGRAE